MIRTIIKEKEMANIKSAKKRVLLERERRVENNSIKSEIKTYIKKFKAELAVDTAKAEEIYNQLASKLDSAARENVIHKNSANRKKAHFSKLLSNAKASK
ncbi:MAG: 30S ribosomal protein S20 [Clostridiales bacterium]|nr:30S ribosomal protein S20 [Clostridiales bacterium]